MSQDKAQNRAYYRIDVLLPMSYRVLSAEEARNPLPATADSLFIEQYFMTELSEIDQRIEHAIALISEKSTIMAGALRAINDKLNFLAHTMDENAIKHAIPTIPVNLSAGGMSFDVAQKIEHGAIIDLLLVLDTRANPLLLRSEVVKIIPQPDGQNMVAVQFHHVSEEARRQLVFFIQSKEIELAREKRGI